MHILLNSDIDSWAIGNLAKGIMKHNSRFNFSYIPVHPRGLANSFMPLKHALDSGVDVWHAMYWNSAKQMLLNIPALKNIPKILQHMNHNSLEEMDWSEFNVLTCATDWALEKLKMRHKNVVKIPYTVDLDRYSYIQDYDVDSKNIGYIGRVVPWKNLDKICNAAKQFGYRVVGSGYVDKPDYWETVDKSVLDFKGGIGRTAMSPGNVKDDVYTKMAVFIMFSTDEKESGTLPLLEAMARGVPVMATSQGMARELIEDGKNGIIFTPENFEEKLKAFMDDPALRQKCREAAWETIKNYPEQRMARAFGKLYYKTAWNDQPVVSVIIPTFNRVAGLIQTVLSVEADPYPAKEIIVVDDGSTDGTDIACRELKKKIKAPLLYLKTGNTESTYGLAQARNMGVIEAYGDVLLFLDDRLTLTKGLGHIAEVKEKEWRHGAKTTKDGISTKRAFMENFSWIRKKDFVDGGMFNERMNVYGGLSQLTREQYRHKVEFVYDDNAEVNENIRAAGKRRTAIWKAKDIIHKLYF